MIRIAKAEEDDLPAILDLQRLAYQSEARLLGNVRIPPLLQTLEDMREEFRGGIFLKALDEGGNIVGSVRGFARNGTLFVGKLMVHPDHQRQGLGTRLLLELEKVCPQPRLELFTSDRSAANIRLYERNGYTRFSEKAVSPDLTFVYLEKRLSV
ncbi:MAG: GNAT family N-acetyltransferase [Bilophila sp.]